LSTSKGETFGQELESLYNKLSNKLRGSKAYKKLLIHKKNLINYYINQLDIVNVKEVVIEKLKKVKHKTKQKKSINTKFMNKMQYWSYRSVIDKLERFCEENGILLTKVNPAYTSQTCSSCGCVDKKSRNGELYNCQHCGYVNDADINAAINISRMGVYSLHSPPS
jgi:IS605 OrfB family transposase